MAARTDPRARVAISAADPRDVEVPVLLPGIKVGTSPANFHPIRQMQLTRFTGEHFELFGKVLQGESA